MLKYFNIHNEDCLITMEKLKNSIDLIVTSPPYNMTSRPGGNADSGRYDVYTDWKTETEYIEWTENIFNNFNKILKENSVVLYNFSYSIENPSLPYKLVASIEKDTDFALVDTIIWKKSTGMPFPANKYRLSRNWEFIWVFVRKSEINTFNTHKGISKISEKTGQTYYNIFYNMIDSVNSDCSTPTLNQATYSSDMVLKLFDIYCDNGYTVYDPFNGTGTTGYACKISRFKDLTYIGSEISKDQCEYSVKRIKNETEITIDSF